MNVAISSAISASRITDSENQGSNAWKPFEQYFKELKFPVGGNPVFADLDKDGDMDLIIGSEAGTLHYFRNEGQ